MYQRIISLKLYFGYYLKILFRFTKNNNNNDEDIDDDDDDDD